jgi:hypothetical protein
VCVRVCMGGGGPRDTGVGIEEEKSLLTLHHGSVGVVVLVPASVCQLCACVCVCVCVYILHTTVEVIPARRQQLETQSRGYDERKTVLEKHLGRLTSLFADVLSFACVVRESV